LTPSSHFTGRLIHTNIVSEPSEIVTVIKVRPLDALRAVLIFIALFHVVAGIGLMFSISFQKLAVFLYAGPQDWDMRSIYFTRIIGSFAFVLGTLAYTASRNPLKYKVIIIGFIEFFLLRNINRHLYAHELYSAFSVKPFVNDLTTVFFGIQALGLGWLLWLSHKDTISKKEN
jgi:hypothetical protein